LRVALLAGLLALASNVAVVGFIHWRTHNQLLDALEDSLPVAIALSLLLGLACGGIVAKYVGGRIRSIVAVTDRITAGDLRQRVRLTSSRDAFDRLGGQINAMLDRIVALMEELRLLTDSLAHGLRSPVSRLRAAAHAAAETADPAERDQQLAKLIGQADALMRILTTVLEISRSEAMTGRDQFAWFDAGELAAELSEMYDPLAEEAGAPLKLERPGGALRVYGHRQLLAQAISNLIENAIRYGAGGGEILVRAAAAGGALAIRVADSGPGIPEDRRDQALRRFGRLDSSRSSEGAGLGLTLVQAIAHLHDGKVLLEDNRPGLGATLIIPAGQAAPAPLIDCSDYRHANNSFHNRREHSQVAGAGSKEPVAC
jgi:signal transduction histidine kinase